MGATEPISLNTYFSQSISSLNDFCKKNNLKITDTNGDGIFDINDKVEYTVQAGDSLSKIARGYEGVSLGQLMQANAESCPNPDKIREGDVLTIPLVQKDTKQEVPQKTLAASQPKPKQEEKEKPFKLETHDFGVIKTRKVTEEAPNRLLKGETLGVLKTGKYYVDDKNGNGIFDDGDVLYKQATVMIDAGHGAGKYLKKGQKITIPQNGSYITKDSDTYESIAKQFGVDVKALQNANPNTKKGYDPGAVSQHGKLVEADITETARDELAKKLRSEGFDVLIAERTDRAHLKERQQEKLAKKPDIYISLHCDSNSGTSANGESVQFNPANKEDKVFADAINESLKKDTTIRNRGAVPRKEGKNGLCVLNGDKNGRTAECLVELGFISNANDYSNLANETTRKKQLDAISDGIKNYYNAHKE